MNNARVFPPRIRASCIAVITMLVASCGVDVMEPGDVGSAQGQMLTRQNEDDLRSLAEDYLFKEVAEDESLAIRTRIKSLSADEAIAFHEILGGLNGYTGVDRELFDAFFSYALSHGISFLELTDKQRTEVLEWFKEDIRLGRSRAERNGSSVLDESERFVCIYPWVSCTQASFPTYMIQYSCGVGECVVGSLNERIGNEGECEFLGCDYQVRFSLASATLIDGTTAAADCAIVGPPAIGARHSNPYSWAIIGYGSTVSCSMVGTIHSQFQARL